MADFGDIDDFDHAVQGKPIKAYRNGHFENPKTLFVQHHWSWDEFLCAASQRLEMVPMASRVFNADGAEIDDIMCIEENDMLFFSTGRTFKAPSSAAGDEGAAGADDKYAAQVVGGYKVSSLLGRGGFGEVRLGVHQLTSDKVALKFILKSEMGSLGDVERTTTEIQCLTALNHPSIIKLIRVVNEPNHVVLVIELLEGGDLFHYLKNVPGGALAEAEGAALFSQILAGVGYAHNQHICHRDLKLENILLSNKNDISNVKIADFGLSDFYKPGAMMKTNCGSISYLAPEVFRGTSNAGPPLDVWSLGVILFAIVCGRLPFEGSDLHGTNRPRENVIRNRIMRCQYKIDEHLSPALTDLITHMLQPDPNERATIPEIFGHPWVRGNSTCDLGADGSLFAARAGGDDGAGGDDDDDFAITYSPIKAPAPAPAAPTVATTPSGLLLGTPHGDDDKLPSLVQRSPSRLEPLQGLHAAAAVVPSGTPSSGRTRPGRIMEHHHPLQTKHSSAKLDKASPRPSGGSGSVGSPSGAALTSPTALGNNGGGGTFKRNPSSTAASGSTRSRQRLQPGGSGAAGSTSTALMPSGAAAGATAATSTAAATMSEREKSHAERAPAHAGDVERLPVAHQKNRRRSEHLSPGESLDVESAGAAKSTASGAGGLEALGKKSHGAGLDAAA